MTLILTLYTLISTNYAYGVSYGLPMLMLTSISPCPGVERDDSCVDAEVTAAGCMHYPDEQGSEIDKSY
jgi:hypothetical protein